jgi:hypothetical protein
MARRRSGPVIALSVLIALASAFVAGSLVTWQAWEAVRPLPTAAEFTAIGRLVAPDEPAATAAFARADPIRNDIADTGTVVPITSYPQNAEDPRRSLEATRDRLAAAGWNVEKLTRTSDGNTSTEQVLVATKDGLRLFLIDEYGTNYVEGRGQFAAKVIRDRTWPALLAGAAGALLGAALAWWFVGWAARWTEGHRVWRALASLAGLATVVLLTPAVSWSLYLALPDSVTIAHNYISEPFWRGLTGEPRAVPAAVAAGVGLVLIVVPVPAFLALRWRRAATAA